MPERLVTNEVIVTHIYKVCRNVYLDNLAFGSIELHAKQDQYSGWLSKDGCWTISTVSGLSDKQEKLGNSKQQYCCCIFASMIQRKMQKVRQICA